MTDVQIVLCETCGSEGRIYRGLYDDERDCGECPACEGTGGEIISVYAIDMEDTMLADGTHYLDANGTLQPKPAR